MDAFGTFFIKVWALFTQTVIPGMNITVAHFTYSMWIITIVIYVVRGLLGLDNTEYRSGGGGNHKISDERRNDQK